MRRSGKGSGGGLGMNKVKHVKSSKSEPKPRSISPAAVNQFGAKVGSHVTTAVGGDTNYRGEDLIRGKGYSTPVGPTDNVKAVGVGGGRTVYGKSGVQGCHGTPASGNPPPKGELFPGWKK